MHAAIREFEAVARDWAPLFRSVTTVVVALRGPDRWHVRHAITAFAPTVPELFNPLDVRTSSVRAVRLRQILDTRSSQKAMRPALANLGRVSIGDETFDLAQNDTLSSHYYRLSPPRFAGPNRIPTLVSDNSPSFPNLPD